MGNSAELTTGYYRLTDIAWEWHDALPNKADVGPLKALIGWEVLVHPDHPLRKPGQDGLELFRGVFENGETRLLFSSAQIEYIRYYLHAMKLTEEPIPIPSSQFLIQKRDLKSCVPDYYSSAATLKKSMKASDKANKRLKAMGPDTGLTSRRLNFERVRSYWASRTGTWLAVDFEGWELESTLLLEFGWSLGGWDADGNEVNEQGHLIVKERMTYQNTQYVIGKRDYYNFGKSELVNRATFKKRITDLIEKASASGPLFLVFHDPSQDIKYLKSDQAMGSRFTGYTYELSDLPPSTGIFILDTAEVFAALEGTSGGNKRSLEQMCRQLQVQPLENLHNAGNDAHYTMLALKSMASGEPLDAQRQLRWPTYVSTAGLHANLPGVDGNPEVDDYEGPNTRNIINENDADMDVI